MNLNKTLVAAAAVVALAGGTTAAVANSSSATLASTSNKISAEHTSRTSTPAANTAALANTNTKDTRGETKRAKTSHNSDQRNPKQENRTRQETTGAHRGSKKRQGAKAVMGALGVTKDELAAARKADKSLEELAADKGISKTDLVAKLTAKTKKRLSKAVSDGKLTQQQADKKLAIMTRKVEHRVSQKPSERRRAHKRDGYPKGHHTKHWGKRRGSQAITKALGVTKDELAAARKADKSLEELAADNGISKTDLVAKLTAKTKKRLSKAVADGKLTQRQADIKMRIITKKVERQISQKPSELSRGAKRTHSESSKEKKPDTAA